jgi:hypothetical protein
LAHCHDPAKVPNLQNFKICKIFRQKRLTCSYICPDSISSELKFGKNNAYQIWNLWNSLTKFSKNSKLFLNNVNDLYVSVLEQNSRNFEWKWPVGDIKKHQLRCWNFQNLLLIIWYDEIESVFEFLLSTYEIWKVLDSLAFFFCKFSRFRTFYTKTTSSERKKNSVCHAALPVFGQNLRRS